jgi:hypothetical protein
MVMAGLLALMGLYLWPVSFLWSAGALGQGMFLAAAGLLVFVPAIILLALVFAIAPVFIVVLRRGVFDAISLSLALVKKKFRECLWFGFVLFATGLLLLLLIGSSIILFSSLAEKAAAGGLLTPELVALFVFLFSVLWTVLVQAVFSVFFSSAWVMAVLQLVGTVNTESAEEYVVEPA